MENHCWENVLKSDKTIMPHNVLVANQELMVLLAAQLPPWFCVKMTSSQAHANFSQTSKRTVRTKGSLINNDTKRKSPKVNKALNCLLRGYES